MPTEGWDFWWWWWCPVNSVLPHDSCNIRRIYITGLLHPHDRYLLVTLAQ